MNKTYFIYILASKRNGTLYVGMTSNIIKRIWEHKIKLFDGFTKEYKVDQLVYYEEYLQVKDAIAREKKLKRWKREWKIALIEEKNPYWKNLYKTLL